MTKPYKPKKFKPKLKCRHCKTGRACRPYYLCTVCYFDAEVRALYTKRSHANGASDSDDIKCRHCNKRKMNRPLGLCFSCYYTPKIRKLYLGGKNNGSHFQDFNGRGAPCAPTEAKPGSDEKIKVLRRRVALKQNPHHEDDPRDEHSYDTGRGGIRVCKTTNARIKKKFDSRFDERYSDFDQLHATGLQLDPGNS